MDHWGDPWADANADANDHDPPKQAVASPPPQHATFAPAPVVLNGFLDDAGWGSAEDEGFGGWAEESRAVQEPRVNGMDGEKGWEEPSRDERRSLDIAEEDEKLPERNEWSLVDEDADELEEDNVDPETSDSATTIQGDHVPAPTAKDSAESLPVDDDLSTRPSTSPSDTSHNEIPAESPRTSFGEERAAEKARASPELEKDKTAALAEEEGPALEHTQVESADAGNDFGDFEDNVAQDATEPQLLESLDQSLPEPSSLDVDGGTDSFMTGEEKHSTPTSRDHNSEHSSEYGSDQTLLSQLFPTTKPLPSLREAPDDPVNSTAARKAWYRLSRKQTMREYNSGTAADDNYIRVTWKTSHIRSEVIKTVSRWATEDRMAGRGPGARASFYWDTPAPPPEQMISPFHARKRSSVSVSNPVARVARESVPKLETDVPAAFDWSSPSAGGDPWRDDVGDVRAVSSPVAPPRHGTVTTLQRQGTRPVSIDLSSRPKEPSSHKRTATNTDLLSEAALAPVLSSISPPKLQTGPPADPWTTLGALDTNPPTEAAPTPAAPQVNEDNDDDDDWGEMVESPAVSAQTPTTHFPSNSFSEPSTPSEPPTRNPTLSTPSTTPRSIRSSPNQPFPQTSGTKHASPIVRLKGTVSPTSALFKINAFVPGSVEDGPIGPGLLRARKRDGDAVDEGGLTPPRAMAQMDEVLGMDMGTSDTAFRKENGNVTEDHKIEDEFSAFETSLPSPVSNHPVSTTPPPPASPTPPAWPEADLSIFDSPLPNAVPPPPQTPTDHNDPWSIFDNPTAVPAPQSTTSTTTTPSLPFTRTPPRPATPPPKQPLTSATSSAQRRKAEEDEIVRGILEGLPDLAYMLGR